MHWINALAGLLLLWDMADGILNCDLIHTRLTPLLVSLGRTIGWVVVLTHYATH